jgi:XTP/dITP diphosphohydrolase
LPVIWIASSNPGKIAEFQLGLRLHGPKEASRGAQVAGQTDVADAWAAEPIRNFYRLPPYSETASTFAGNAQGKALHYSRLTDGLVFADDSGLEVDALRGAPGVKSRRFAGPGATDADNRAKLLILLGGVPLAKRTARFVCELAVARHGELLAHFRAVSEGLILAAPRGEAGFGYDPLFLDPESDRTYAELSPTEKLARSHRGRALRAMLEWLATQSSQQALSARLGH